MRKVARETFRCGCMTAAALSHRTRGSRSFLKEAGAQSAARPVLGSVSSSVRSRLTVSSSMDQLIRSISPQLTGERAGRTRRACGRSGLPGRETRAGPPRSGHWRWESVLGVLRYDWGFSELSALFLVAGLTVGVVAGRSLSHAAAGLLRAWKACSPRRSSLVSLVLSASC